MCDVRLHGLALAFMLVCLHIRLLAYRQVQVILLHTSLFLTSMKTGDYPTEKTSGLEACDVQVRFNMPDPWHEHRLLHIFHSLSSAE